MARTWTTLSEGGHFFESPRWHDGTWWVSDFYAHAVQTVASDGTRTTVLEVEGQPSGIGWLPDGDMLVVSMKDQRVLRRGADGSVTEHADIAEHCGGIANDMVVDAQGRAFVGNFGFNLMSGADPTTADLVRVDPDGSVHVAAEGLHFPNGAVILPDDRTLVVGETIGCRYTAFTIADDGSLTDRRTWAQLSPTPELTTFDEVLATAQVAPDGCGLDADGAIWFADALGARVVRVAEGGEVLDEVGLPEGLGAFACMVGGEDDRTLLVCAAPDFLEHNRAPVTEAVLLTTTVDVPAAGRP